MAAIGAGRRGRRVLVLDHNAEPGAKIVISGGGRCNFTNSDCRPDRFLGANPHFCRSALARYTPQDFLALVEKHGIAWHEKTLGQLFCDGSARQIVAMLLSECEAAGVEIALGKRIGAVDRPDRFRVDTDVGAIEAESLIVATGGPSIPKLGASGFAYRLAERFAVPVTELAPALVPFTFDGDALPALKALAGVSLRVVGRVGEGKRAPAFDEAMLFTHRGLSGPALLQLSSYWRQGGEIRLDLAPGTELGAFLRGKRQSRGKAELQTILTEILPQRLAQAVTEESGARGPLGGLPQRILDGVAARIGDWRVRPSGTEGYAKAEVTRGGIDTAALSSRTMGVTAVPGLFFVGEAVDVTGWLGGYNFQWAWSSGWAAGQAA
ncbi:NAD(P)/FAD-dependent oxidoreductase [Acetobacteraceae bacterium KSS8]|uniref:NAD(P)/FAD-dependent oxidoreductase n=2 Tax=Endosaccharibacter trunci TaxID=2812733 RepID=A0ABT1W7V7_9PROT|nr:NAD(P)/FAD-dependent oxidoreductase [Acetobacteraceae bacterium KSS8]